MRTFDDINEDFALATNDEARALIIAESDTLAAQVASEQRGDPTAYNWLIGQTRQAHRTASEACSRVRARTVNDAA